MNVWLDRETSFAFPNGENFFRKGETRYERERIFQQIRSVMNCKTLKFDRVPVFVKHQEKNIFIRQDTLVRMKRCVSPLSSDHEFIRYNRKVFLTVRRQCSFWSILVATFSMNATQSILRVSSSFKDATDYCILYFWWQHQPHLLISPSLQSYLSYISVVQWSLIPNFHLIENNENHFDMFKSKKFDGNKTNQNHHHLSMETIQLRIF